MNDLTRQALRLARADCIGTVSHEHLLELRRLCKTGLVKPINTDYSAYYTLTNAGRERLRLDKVANNGVQKTVVRNAL